MDPLSETVNVALPAVPSGWPRKVIVSAHMELAVA